MIFGSQNYEDELLLSMEKLLDAKKAETKTHGLQKLAQAVDLLNRASSIFESNGLYTEANEITHLLEQLAKDFQ